tara:strand:+ start:3635 stop:4147 length:513 start_codon:yes stop_codon:yes gene_type:complete
MASTVVNSTFTSTITDSISLNSKAYGNTNTVTIGSCNEAYERILSIPAYGTEPAQDFIPILSCTASPESAGDVSNTEFEYARFTNLDSEYPIKLKFMDTTSVCVNPTGATEAFIISIEPGMSYVVPSAYWMSAAGNITGLQASTGLGNVWTVYALSVTAVCELEMFVVTK